MALSGALVAQAHKQVSSIDLATFRFACVSLCCAFAVVCPAVVKQVVHAEANALLNKNQAHVTGAVSVQHLFLGGGGSALAKG